MAPLLDARGMIAVSETATLSANCDYDAVMVEAMPLHRYRFRCEANKTYTLMKYASVAYGAEDPSAATIRAIAAVRAASFDDLLKGSALLCAQALGAFRHAFPGQPETAVRDAQRRLANARKPPVDAVPVGSDARPRLPGDAGRGVLGHRTSPPPVLPQHRSRSGQKPDALPFQHLARSTREGRLRRLQRRVLCDEEPLQRIGSRRDRERIDGRRRSRTDRQDVDLHLRRDRLRPDELFRPRPRLRDHGRRRTGAAPRVRPLLRDPLRRRTGTPQAVRQRRDRSRRVPCEHRRQRPRRSGSPCLRWNRPSRR
ncbi:MAG: hypothetical protein MZU97_13230 [Bacillus subtilis]|nr:hypothetical protein [Bacillus subtilis]